MGTLGTGLYSSDFALDLRATIGAVARLPFEPAHLLRLLCEAEPSTSQNVTDSDHTIFWLVIADQFSKRGIDCSQAREMALAIIKDGADLAAMRALGMDKKAITKREIMLAEIQTRISQAPEVTKPRNVLKAPQRLLLEVGEVLIYPTCMGNPINPYAVGKYWAWVKAWKQDGWGAFTVVDRGLAFGFLAWYWPLVISVALPGEPTIEELLGPLKWLTANAGTLSARHYKNLQLNSLGHVSIDADKVTALIGRRTMSVTSAVNDISLSNSLRTKALDFRDTGHSKIAYSSAAEVNALDEILRFEG